MKTKQIKKDKDFYLVISKRNLLELIKIIDKESIEFFGKKKLSSTAILYFNESKKHKKQLTTTKKTYERYKLL